MTGGRRAFLGIDIGTSSSKGVLVDSSGIVLGSTAREHAVDRPAPGHFEMAAGVWWDEFASIARELLGTSAAEVAAVGISGMGPCVCVTDEDAVPLRPAILYGIDTRAEEQARQLTAQLGADAIVARCGSALSTQSVGPKLRWIAQNEPTVYAKASKLFMPSSWLAFCLTGAYVLDHHSASQSTPMYDTAAHQWFGPWAREVAPQLQLPRLVWPAEIAGEVTQQASAITSVPEGTPVIAGTIDAWSEAVSVGAHHPGDLMLMYGTTMFFVNTVEHRPTSRTLWGTVGAFPGTYSLAAGMATSGAVTSWLRDLLGSPQYEALIAEAATSGVGADGLLMLPYFAGERTPIADPGARGVIAGLTLSHTRGDLYRAALEATGYGARHNVQAIRDGGGEIRRVVAVGGGTRAELWTQIVSDVAGLEQQIPTTTIGASFGAAFLAASAVGDPEIDEWNPISHTIFPDQDTAAAYDQGFQLYRQLYDATAPIVHQLAGSAGGR